MVVVRAGMTQHLPSIATLVSPLTGELGTYALLDHHSLAQPNTRFDPEEFRAELDAEYYTQGLDVQCAQTGYISSELGSFVEVQNYVRVGDVGEIATLEIGTLAAPALIAAIVMAIKTVALKLAILVVALAGALLVYQWLTHTWDMETKWPKNVYVQNPETGEGGWYNQQQGYTLKQAYNPGKWIDPKTDTILDPYDPDFEAHKEFVLKNTPANWGDPQLDIPWANIINLLIIGAVAIGGVVVAVKVLPSLLAKKTEG